MGVQRQCSRAAKNLSGFRPRESGEHYDELCDPKGRKPADGRNLLGANLPSPGVRGLSRDIEKPTARQSNRRVRGDHKDELT